MEDNEQVTLDLSLYLSALGLPKIFIPQPTEETLYLIVNKHVLNIFYQNFDFHDKDLKYQELSVENLQQILLLKKEGGNCFKLTELLYLALEKIGFEAYRVFANMLDGKPHDSTSNKPALHFFIIVKLNHKMFLIDCGFSYNSLRYPLEFEPEKTQEIEINPFEKYKLEFNNDHYVLYLLIKDEWVSLMSFSHPLKPVLHEEVEERYRFLIETPEKIAIRDKLIKIGKLTEDGRVGIKWIPEKEGFDSLLILHVNGQIIKNKHNNYNELANDAKYYFGFNIPALNSLKHYSS